MAGHETQPSGVAEDVARLIRDFIVAVDRFRQGAANQLNVDSSGVIAMIFLVDQDLTPSELASALELTSASVTALVDRLSDADLVERLPHPEDRRSLLVTLTPTGRRAVGDVAQTLVDAVERALSAVGTRHHSAVARFLRVAGEEVLASRPDE